MIALILFIIFGLLFGYFATLNTLQVAIHFGSISYDKVPMYVLILSSFAIGVLFTSLFTFFKQLSERIAKKNVENELAASKKNTADLLKKIHQLELEMVKLKTKYGHKDSDDDSI